MPTSNASTDDDERAELLRFFEAIPSNNRKGIGGDHYTTRTIPAALDYLNPMLSEFIENRNVRKLLVAGAKQYLLAKLAETREDTP